MLKKKGGDDYFLLYQIHEGTFFLTFNFYFLFPSPSDFKDPESDHQKKKGTKFKPIKALKRLSHKGEPGKSPSPRKEKS